MMSFGTSTQQKRAVRRWVMFELLPCGLILGLSLAGAGPQRALGEEALDGPGPHLMETPIMEFQTFDPAALGLAERRVLEAVGAYLTRYRELVLPEGRRPLRPPHSGILSQWKADAVRALLLADRIELTRLAESWGGPGRLEGEGEAAWETIWYRVLPRWLARRGVLLHAMQERVKPMALDDLTSVEVFSLYRIERIDRNVPRVIWGESIALDELEVHSALRLSDLEPPLGSLSPFADRELAFVSMPAAEAELAYGNLVIYAPSLTESESKDIEFFARHLVPNPQTGALARQTWQEFSEGFMRLASQGRRIDPKQYAMLRLGAQFVDQEGGDLARLRSRWQAMRRERLRVHERNHARDQRLGRIPPPGWPRDQPGEWARFLNRWQISPELGSYLTGIRALRTRDMRLSLTKLLADVEPHVSLVARLANLAVLDRLVTEVQENPERYREVMTLEGRIFDRMAEAGLTSRAQIIAQLPLLGDEELGALLDAVHAWHEAHYEQLFVPLEATYVKLLEGPVVQLITREGTAMASRPAAAPEPPSREKTWLAEHWWLPVLGGTALLLLAYIQGRRRGCRFPLRSRGRSV